MASGLCGVSIFEKALPEKSQISMAFGSLRKTLNENGYDNLMMFSCCFQDVQVKAQEVREAGLKAVIERLAQSRRC